MSDAIQQEAIKLIQTASCMVVATASKNGHPHASVMLYATDDAKNLYMMTHAGTQKVKDIEENPEVSFVIGFGPPLSIQGDGIASEVKDEAVIDEMMDKIALKTTNIDNFWPPLEHYGRSDEYVLFTIRPTSMRALNLGSTKISTTEEFFTNISL